MTVSASSVRRRRRLDDCSTLPSARELLFPDTNCRPLVLAIRGVEHLHGLLDEGSERGSRHSPGQLGFTGPHDDENAFIVEVGDCFVDPEDGFAHDLGASDNRPSISLVDHEQISLRSSGAPTPVVSMCARKAPGSISNLGFRVVNEGLSALASGERLDVSRVFPVLVEHETASVHGKLGTVPRNPEGPSPSTAGKFAQQEVSAVFENRRGCGENNGAFGAHDLDLSPDSAKSEGRSERLTAPSSSPTQRPLGGVG